MKNTPEQENSSWAAEDSGFTSSPWRQKISKISYNYSARPLRQPPMHFWQVQKAAAKPSRPVTQSKIAAKRPITGRHIPKPQLGKVYAYSPKPSTAAKETKAATYPHSQPKSTYQSKTTNLADIQRIGDKMQNQGITSLNLSQTPLQKQTIENAFQPEMQNQTRQQTASEVKTTRRYGISVAGKELFAVSREITQQEKSMPSTPGPQGSTSRMTEKVMAFARNQARQEPGVSQKQFFRR